MDQHQTSSLRSDETKAGLQLHNASYRKWARNMSVDSYKELNRLNLIEKQRHLLELQRQDRLFNSGTTTTTNHHANHDNDDDDDGAKLNANSININVGLKTRDTASGHLANKQKGKKASHTTVRGLSRFEKIGREITIIDDVSNENISSTNKQSNTVNRCRNNEAPTIYSTNDATTTRCNQGKRRALSNDDDDDDDADEIAKDDTIGSNKICVNSDDDIDTIQDDNQYSVGFPQPLHRDNMIEFASNPVPPNMTYQCLIVRDKTGLNKSFYPTYYLILQAIINNNNLQYIDSSTEESLFGKQKSLLDGKESSRLTTINSLLARRTIDKTSTNCMDNNKDNWGIESGLNSERIFYDDLGGAAADDDDDRLGGDNSFTDSFSNASLEEEEEEEGAGEGEEDEEALGGKKRRDKDLDGDVMGEANSGGSGVGHCGSISRDISDDDFKDDNSVANLQLSSNNNNSQAVNNENIIIKSNLDTTTRSQRTLVIGNNSNGATNGGDNSQPIVQLKPPPLIATANDNLRSAAGYMVQPPAVTLVDGRGGSSFDLAIVSSDQTIESDENHQAQISTVGGTTTTTAATTTIGRATPTRGLPLSKSTPPSGGKYSVAALVSNRHHPKSSIILTGRRRKKTKTYLIALDEHDIARKEVVCKLKSNVLGTQFNAIRIYKRRDDGIKQRFNLASINYETNVLGFKGPRKMNIIIPDTNYLLVENLNLYEESKKSNSQSIIQIRNKTPTWNEESESYVLNFHGRVTQASVKNFQLIYIPRLQAALSSNDTNNSNPSYAAIKSAEQSRKRSSGLTNRDHQLSRSATTKSDVKHDLKEPIASIVNSNQQPQLKTSLSAYNDFMIMQFGRISEREFTCDVSHPLSLLQAFSIALSSFDSKLACE